MKERGKPTFVSLSCLKLSRVILFDSFQGRSTEDLENLSG